MVKAKSRSKPTSRKITLSNKEITQFMGKLETAFRIHLMINLFIGVSFLLYLRSLETDADLIKTINRMLYALIGISTLLMLISPFSKIGAVLTLANTAMWVYLLIESYTLSKATRFSTAYHLYIAVIVIILIKDVGIMLL